MKQNKNSNKAADKKLTALKMTIPTLKYMLKTAWKAKKSVFFIYLLDFIGMALGDLKLILLPKLIVDELVLIKGGAPASEHLSNIILYVGLTVVLEFISRVIQEGGARLKDYYSEWFDQHFQYILSEKSMEMDFQYTEDPEVLTQQNKAKEGISWYSGGVMGILSCFFNIIYNIVLMCTVVTIIAFYCPLLIPVQVIGMALVCWFYYKNQKINLEFFLKLAKSNRLFGYFFYEIASFQYGKDIRMYKNSDMLIDRANVFGDEQIGLWHGQALATRRNSYGSAIANAVRDDISYFYMGIRALLGYISLGDFTMCVSSASRLYQSLLGISGNARDITEKCSYAYQFLVFLQYPDAFEKGNDKVNDGEHVIEFEHVYFKYPRSEEYVLEDINLTIKPGEHLSIVGLNGAGKTTFIKLLCRLYDVTSGRILIDGTDIKKYSQEEYRKLFAVVFQDFQLFAFSLKDNILMGDADREADETAMEEALKLSGLYDDAMALSQGVDTLLFKSFDEHGTELSGGQKQKAAISRALYRNAPIVILDEPTAALDPMAEYDIYKKFDTLVENKSAIYISHRLSSCKFCDKIAVFADKTIKEYGTHDELIKVSDGIYSEMFNTQAQYYVDATA